MFFYRIEVKAKNLIIKTTPDDELDGQVKLLRVVPQPFHRQTDKNGTIFISSLIGDNMVQYTAIGKRFRSAYANTDISTANWFSLRLKSNINVEVIL